MIVQNTLREQSFLLVNMNSTGGTVKRVFMFGDNTGYFIELEKIAGCFWSRGKPDVAAGDRVAVQFNGEYNEKDSDSRKIEKLIKLA